MWSCFDGACPEFAEGLSMTVYGVMMMDGAVGFAAGAREP